MRLSHISRQSIILNLLDRLTLDKANEGVGKYILADSITDIDTPSLIILAQAASVDKALLELIVSRGALCSYIRSESVGPAPDRADVHKHEHFRACSLLDAMLIERDNELDDHRSVQDVIESDDRLDADLISAMTSLTEHGRRSYDVKRYFKEYDFCISEHPPIAKALVECLKSDTEQYTSYIKEMGVHCSRSSILCNAIHEMLRDSQDEACLAALWLLVQMPRRGGLQAAFVPRLLELLDDESEQVRGLAIDAISCLRNIAREHPPTMCRLREHFDLYQGEEEHCALGRAFSGSRLFMGLRGVDDLEVMIKCATDIPCDQIQLALAQNAGRALQSAYRDEAQTHATLSSYLQARRQSNRHGAG